MIALLCSVNAEAELLAARMNAAQRTTAGSKIFTRGTIAGRPIVLCTGGMGKVNAAHASTLLVSRYAPEALVIFGVGGAYTSAGASVGEVVVATEEIAGDEGVLTAEGFKDTEYMAIPLLKTAATTIFNHYPADDLLLKKAIRVLNGPGLQSVRTGPFVTLSCCTGTAARARDLEERYSGLCENMEGAAAAHVAACHSLPWLEVRAISNRVEERDLSKWDIPGAARAVQETVVRILEGWDR